SNLSIMAPPKIVLDNPLCSFAPRPVVPGTEPGIPPTATMWLDAIQQIYEFNHPVADILDPSFTMNEGHVLVKWHGIAKTKWVPLVDVMKYGNRA
ncbi:hypothetical protein PFISCL1PPCAC_6527, partial [Pristionchus fissidentatus]